MIVSFSVSNFRSFAGEETLSLVASKRLSSSHPAHVTAIPGSHEGVLRTAVLYGANGAGKSNVCKALNYLRGLTLRSGSKEAGTSRQAFRFGNWPQEPTSFDLQFIANDKLYRFGIKLDDERILEEWLVQVVRGRERIIYERVTSSGGEVTIQAPGLKNPKLKALATVGGPQNQLFLATVNVTLDRGDSGEPLNGVLNWFQSALTLLDPDEAIYPTAHMLATQPQLCQFAGDFLSALSTGVDGLRAKRIVISEDEVRTLLPDAVATRISDTLRSGTANVRAIGLGDLQLAVERSDLGVRFFRLEIKTAHNGPSGEVTFDLQDESDGTRRLLDLAPVVYSKARPNSVHVIDEIDRSLHPSVVRSFLESFLQQDSQTGRQLIVTTHESSLLDLSLLRRDEIWFAEKDSNSATHLYSLSDFKVRNDLEIRKHYIQGRFGAIPFLGGVERLIDEPVHVRD